MAVVVASCRLWIGGVCRRPSLRQLELTACCWPCFWKGTVLLAECDRCKPVRTVFGVSLVIVFVLVCFSCLSRFGWAQQGWVLLDNHKRNVR